MESIDSARRKYGKAKEDYEKERKGYLAFLEKQGEEMEFDDIVVESQDNKVVIKTPITIIHVKPQDVVRLARYFTAASGKYGLKV